MNHFLDKYNSILKYLLNNKIISLLSIYFIFSILVNIFLSIDILIPCLWKTIFGVECPGCGLTTAFIKLVTFDIKGAYTTNPLIFIVLPAGIYFIYKDYKAFVAK